MFGVLGKILGSDKVIEKGIQLIDDIHTSEAEAVEVKAKAKADLLGSYAPFKLAQRYLALMFATTFLLCFGLVLGMGIWGDAKIETVRAILDEFYIGEIMLTIVAFYFGGGALEGVVNKAKSKG